MSQPARRVNRIVLGDLDDQGGTLQPGYEQLHNAVDMLETNREAYLVMPLALARSLQGWEWEMLAAAGCRTVTVERR